jgi:geranylgeranyl pyrophosphate synthase
MDNDCLRRGRPTLHILYGDGIAILAGDAHAGRSVRLMARGALHDDPLIVARKLAALRVVASAAGAVGMVWRPGGGPSGCRPG